MSADKPVIDEELQAYADNELEPERRLVIARYLEANPDAAKKVAAIVAQTALVRAATAPLRDPAIPTHLRIERLAERERDRRHARFAFGGGWSSIAAAFFGVFILGAASGWGLHGGFGGNNRIRPLVEEAADTYVVYEPDRLHPVEISASNRDELNTWVSSRLGRPISAPDTIADFTLLGGRVIATSRGPAAMFMYVNTRGKRIVMLVCPLSLHGTAPITDSSPDGLAGVSWSDQGVGYSLVGPISGKELHGLGQNVRSQMADKA
jgi:anti-sigma factor RsiW